MSISLLPRRGATYDVFLFVVWGCKKERRKRKESEEGMWWNAIVALREVRGGVRRWSLASEVIGV